MYLALTKGCVTISAVLVRCNKCERISKLAPSHVRAYSTVLHSIRATPVSITQTWLATRRRHPARWTRGAFASLFTVQPPSLIRRHASNVHRRASAALSKQPPRLPIVSQRFQLGRYIRTPTFFLRHTSPSPLHHSVTTPQALPLVYPPQPQPPPTQHKIILHTQILTQSGQIGQSSPVQSSASSLMCNGQQLTSTSVYHVTCNKAVCL